MGWSGSVSGSVSSGSVGGAVGATVGGCVGGSVGGAVGGAVGVSVGGAVEGSVAAAVGGAVGASVGASVTRDVAGASVVKSSGAMVGLVSVCCADSEGSLPCTMVQPNKPSASTPIRHHANIGFMKFPQISLKSSPSRVTKRQNGWEGVTLPAIKCREILMRPYSSR